MLIRAARSTRGFSLIELMVVIALIGILLALAIPGIGSWTADVRLRGAAEALTNQVRLAQAMAVSRNRVGILVLTNSTPAYNGTPAANGKYWYVILDPLASESLSAASMLASSGEASQNSVSVTGPALVCFNSLGQQTSNSTTALSASLSCQSPGTDDSATTAPTTYYELTRSGSQRKFRVLVYAGGRVRMCDALKTLSTSSPDGCP